MVHIARLAEQDWDVYCDVRLASLEEAPSAFGSLLATERDRTEAEWSARVQPVDEDDPARGVGSQMRRVEPPTTDGSSTVRSRDVAAGGGSVSDERVINLAARYGDTADAYRDLWAPALLPSTVALLDRLPLADAHVVLDLGTGVGAAIPDIKARAPNAIVLGVDRSIGMLRLVPEGTARVATDAMRLAIASDTVDVVVSAFMLFHLPDPMAGLREIHRVARPGSAIGIATWGSEADVPAWDIWEEELTVSGAPESDPSAHLMNQQMMDTRAKMRSLLGDAGFSSVRVETRSLDFQPDLETFLALATRWASHDRLEALPAGERRACIERTQQRLGEMPPEGFDDPSEILLVTAVA